MRGLEKCNTPILTGYQLFHSYLRPHEASKGKTPLILEGKTTISYASEQEEPHSYGQQKLFIQLINISKIHLLLEYEIL